MLYYFTPASLDGFLGDGEYDWSAPSDEVMAFIVALQADTGTHLLGRRNYETMAVWETPDFLPSPTAAELAFQRQWTATDKIVFSRTLAATTTSHTRLERDFDLAAIRALKAGPKDVSISGPTLANVALRAGLVDEIRLLVAPALLGAGIRVLAAPRAQLALREDRRFANGMVYLRYAI